MLVSAKEMLDKAKAGKYAVGHFNINNLEWTKAILLTAQENNSPVILGVSEGAGKYMTGFKTVVGMVNGMLEELSRRLIEGGYTADTPAAIVYKATWEDEKKFVCTVGTLAQTAKENHITKTALMIIGDCVNAAHYDRSKLYDPGFTTEFREATK